MFFLEALRGGMCNQPFCGREGSICASSPAESGILSEFRLMEIDHEESQRFTVIRFSTVPSE